MKELIIGLNDNTKELANTIRKENNLIDYIIYNNPKSFKLDLKYVIILSIVVTLALLIQLIFNMNFILTFTLYVLLVLILTFYKLLKMDIQNKKIFIWAYIVVVIGGIFLLSRIKLHYLNYNGICHIFTAIAIFMFALALKKD